MKYLTRMERQLLIAMRQLLSLKNILDCMGNIRLKVILPQVTRKFLQILTLAYVQCLHTTLDLMAAM